MLKMLIHLLEIFEQWKQTIKLIFNITSSASHLNILVSFQKIYKYLNPGPIYSQKYFNVVKFKLFYFHINWKKSLLDEFGCIQIVFK